MTRIVAPFRSPAFPSFTRSSGAARLAALACLTALALLLAACGGEESGPPPQGEPPPTGPTVLQYGTSDLPAAITVRNGSNAVFEITGVTAGMAYVLSVTDRAGLIEWVSDGVGALCSASATGIRATCLAVATGTTLRVTVGNSTGADATATLDAARPQVLTFGTSDLPAAVTLYANATEYFEIAGLTPATEYTFRQTGTNISLDVLSDDQFTTSVCVDSGYYKACPVAATATSMYITLYNFSSGTLGPTLSAELVPVLAFGTADLPAGSLTVGPNAWAFIHVTGLTASDYYGFYASGNGGYNIDLYVDEPGSSNLCQSWGSASAEACPASPSGSSLRVLVLNNTASTATYTFDVVSPQAFALGSLPVSGLALPPNAVRYYEVTGLTPAATYRLIYTSSFSANLFAILTDSPGSSGVLCQALSSGTRFCIAISNSTRMILEMTNETGNIDSITLDAQPVEAYDQASLPVTGLTVGASAAKYFRVGGITRYTNYLTTVSGTSDIDLHVSDDSSFLILSCSSATASAVESCTATNVRDDSLYIRVIDASGVGSTFSLDVQPP